MITTTGFTVSDLICQAIEYKYGPTSKHENARRPFVWDKARTFKFSAIGFLFGPQFHYWVPFVAGLIPGHTPATALKRVIIDQALMGCWATSSVLFEKEILDGNGIQAGFNNIRLHFWEVYLKACCIFPPGQFINYLLIPPHYRVLWLNGIGFCWRIILSYLVYGKPPQPMEQDSKSEIDG